MQVFSDKSEICSSWCLSPLVAFLLGANASSESPNQYGAYHLPAEFEQQDAVWITWPNWDGFHKDNEYVCYLPQSDVAVNTIKALEHHVHIKLVVNSDAIRKQVARKLQDSKVPLGNISFHMIPYQDIGTRDWGPIYVVDSQEKNKQIVHFPFNYWGMPQYADPAEMKLDDEFAGKVAQEEGLLLIDAKIISEGGNRDSNGKGTMMVVEKTELHRNPGWTKRQLEAEYERVLGVKKVIWLPRGVVEDDLSYEAALPGPDGVTLNAYAYGAGHIDEVARFADEHTILLSWVTEEEAAQNPIAAMDRIRLLEDYEYLRKSTDQEAKHFRIVPVPAPNIIYNELNPDDVAYKWISPMQFADGSTFPVGSDPAYLVVPASYMNFIISNGVIVMPKYYQRGMSDVFREKDAQALAIMQSVFPGREVVAVDPLAHNFNSGGGMHCSFQQEPSLNSG